MRSSVSGSTVTLVSDDAKFFRIFVGDYPSEGVKMRHSPIVN